jgi:hypothetical protein
LFSEITGRSAASWLEICETTPAARLPLLMLSASSAEPRAGRWQDQWQEGDEVAGAIGNPR